MYRERLEDLSIFYWLTALFADTPYVKIVDGFPTTGLVIPSVAVDAKTLRRVPFEMGNRTGLEPRVWFIDVFAETKAQRDDFGYRILNNIETNIPVYDYNSGFPPTVVPQLGSLEVREIKMEIIKVFPELVDKLYWRASISFEAVYTNF